MAFTRTMSRIWEKLSSWEEESTKREKILIIIVTLILPVFLFIKFSYLPQREKIKTLREELQKLELERAKLEDLLKKEKLILGQIEERKRFLEEVKNILPSEKEIPRLLQKVSQIAKANKLEILKFTPQTEQKKDYYEIIPFNMELRGKFMDLLKCLNEIESNPRLVTLKELEISPPTQKDEKLLIKGTFNTYKYTGEPLQKRQGK